MTGIYRQAAAGRTLLVRGTTRLPLLGSPVVSTIGSFDGVHRGHARLLGRVQEVKRRWQAEGLKPTSVVISFHPHPSVVLGRRKKLLLISSLRQRLEILSSFGVDILYLVHFTERFSHMRADDFISRILVGELDVRHLIVGPDATVGYEREGDVAFLRDRFAALGREFESMPACLVDGTRVSSDRIRRLIGEGRVEGVEALLGRNFILDAVVIRGDRRGSRLGFPTANLKRNEQILPADGVYVTKARLRDREFGSITNVGRRPTFAGADRVAETHFFSFGEGDFYHERIQVEFLQRLRGEQKFSGAEELQRQISRDIAEAKRILGEHGARHD